MNKKVLAAFVSTLAFGTVTVASASEPAAKDAAKPEKPAKGKKADKADKDTKPAPEKKGGEGSCGGDKKCGAK